MRGYDYILKIRGGEKMVLCINSGIPLKWTPLGPKILSVVARYP